MVHMRQYSSCPSISFWSPDNVEKYVKAYLHNEKVRVQQKEITTLEGYEQLINKYDVIRNEKLKQQRKEFYEKLKRKSETGFSVKGV